MAGERQQAVDAARLAAAISVVFLHTLPPNQDAPASLAAPEIIRAACRWAVPFFLLAAGYFAASVDTAGIRLKAEQIGRLVRAFLVASLLYLPVMLALSKANPATLFVPALLVEGTYFHLWFMGALISGLLVAALGSGRAWLLALAAVGLGGLVAYWACDRVAALHPEFGQPERLFRIVGGMGYIAWGALLKVARPRVPNAAWAGMALVGLALSLAELVWAARAAQPVAFRQMFVGTPLLACGLFRLSLGVDLPPAWRRLAEWGREFSFPLYILHPLLGLAWSSTVMRRLGIALPPVAVPLLTLLTCAVALAALHRLAPSLLALIGGRVPERTVQAPRA